MTKDIGALAASVVGRPYEVGGTGPDAFDCFGLLRWLWREGLGVELPDAPHNSAVLGREVWCWDDPRDPSMLVRPWDVLVLAMRNRVVGDHLGVMVDARSYVHARQRVGVCVEPMAKWVPRLVQVVRANHLSESASSAA